MNPYDAKKIEDAAYTISQSVCAMIEAMGMVAANAQFPENQPYQDKQFKSLIEKYDIHHNAVIAGRTP